MMSNVKLRVAVVMSMLLLSFGLQGSVFSRVAAQEAQVYICMGPNAYAYHNNRGCSGLNRCSCEIRKVSLSEAKRLGRDKPCGKCYK